MHIVIDGRELRTTTGRYIERLLHYLQRLDTTHTYTVLLAPKDYDGWEPTSEHFTKVACPHKEFSLDEQLGLLHQLNGLHADLVHFPMVQQPVLYRGRVVTTMNDLTTVRFSNPTKNALVFWLKQRVYVWVNKRVARKSAALITYTEFVRDDVVAYTGAEASKFTVTNLAADPITDEPKQIDALAGKQFIMYIGRPLPHKNLGRLIDAFAQLQQTHPELVLVLAGRKDANYRLHEATATEQGINNVIFTDFIAEGELRWLYKHCTAYVMPSLSEGFGLPGLEAMLHDAPVVSSNATCLPEVYGDAAHYFDPLSVDDMARAIDEVISNEALQKELAEKGKVQVAKYSWERMARTTLDVYTKVLNQE